uniref:Uncharacterized protein n=1 Tax=Arundo donax TaxID=35708 RepID=A0A0A9FSA6_ARUDO
MRGLRRRRGGRCW